jgi:HlyD family secretion protein
VAQARQSLAVLQAGTRAEEIRQAEASSRSAAEQARSAQTNLSENTLRAPQDGTVERVLIAVGELVAPNAPVIRMTDPTDIWLRIYVPERDLARFSTGSDAVLLVDGVPDPLDALVESIATQGEFTPANLQTPDERGKQVFAVRLRLRRTDRRVKAGMVATVKRIGQWQ